MIELDGRVWGPEMRRLTAVFLLLVCAASAEAAPPSSCAGKFIGDWRHSGSGNRGTLKPDGAALCSEHPACVQGTWTCSGNVLTYTNSLGSWNYTLEPDGRSMSTNGGAAVAVRIGAVPASARSRDLGSAAKNVTADILGIDRTPSAAPEAGPPAAAKPSLKPSMDRTKADSGEGAALFGAGKEAFNNAMRASYESRKSYLRTAEHYFKRSAEEFRKTGDLQNEAKAKENIEKIRAVDAKTADHAPPPEPKPKAAGGQLSRQQCTTMISQINRTQVALLRDPVKGSDAEREVLKQQKAELEKRCNQ